MSLNDVPTQINEPFMPNFVGEANSGPVNHGLQYAKEKNVFPSLHLDKNLNGQRYFTITSRYRKTKNREAVKFVLKFLDYCWEHEKTTQHEVGFYRILFEFNQSLDIKTRGEEIIAGSRMALCYIIRYIELSGKYNKKFFQEIWKDAPVEVKSEIGMSLT